MGRYTQKAQVPLVQECIPEGKDSGVFGFSECYLKPRTLSPSGTLIDPLYTL